MADLGSLGLFSTKTDVVISSDGVGWGLSNGKVVNAKSGNDVIIGTGSARGIFIRDKATFSTGDGSDRVAGIGGINGIDITGEAKLNTGAGNDKVEGSGGAKGVKVDNGSILNTGSGNDKVQGTGGDYGIWITSITSLAVLETEDGNDVIIGSGGTAGIFVGVLGSLESGGGNDVVIGIGGNAGIEVDDDSSINTGAGNDVVDALTGGFAGGGQILLEDGRDTLKGFGEVTADGGLDDDKILFGEGIYEVSGTTITKDGSTGTMTATNFEQIGGAEGGLFVFGDGVLTVDQSGFATSFINV